MTVKLFLVALALLSSLGLATAAGESQSIGIPAFDLDESDQLTSSCKSTTETIGPCEVHFSVCYGFYKRHWRYTATACASGICASSGHTESAKGAAEDAAKALFAMGPACAKPAALNAAPIEVVLEEPEESFEPRLTSSCKSATETIGPCSVHFSICYGFHGLKWRYTATACASGICASSGHTKSAKGAAEDAAKALFAKGPACAKPAALQATDDSEAAAPPQLKGTLFAKLADIAAPADDQLTSSCKSTTETIGPCSVHFSVCYGFYKRHWRYTATACASGICASSGHTKSAKGAAEDAAKALFAMGPACAKPAAEQQ